ncbi:MAG: neutral/alkaline non-lysosomal ceramidase N-terminal domain-containing protein, partial [bacterium]
MNLSITNRLNVKPNPLRRISAIYLAILVCLACVFTPIPNIALADKGQSEWKAGAASIVITPEHPMWMAGYAARTKPSEGKVHDLNAKALALEDGRGTRLVVVTLDLVGINRPFRDKVEKEVEQRYKIPPEGLLLNASHTHCGPELRPRKAVLYGLPEERVRQSREYLDFLREKLLQVIGEALDNRVPAQLAYTHGRAGFAMNRRLITDQGVLNRPNPDGPVDHDVPVLRVDSPEGKLLAVLFGYACHSTTLDFYKFCGDYGGFAQRYLKEAHPGITALFMSGCGGDQNPQPRGIVDPEGWQWPRKPTDSIPYQSPRDSIELAQRHGLALANGVEAALL